MNISRQWNTLKVEVTNHLATITINRPAKLNALNIELLHELKDLLLELKMDDTFLVRGLIVTGEGEKAFIAGADIAEMSDIHLAN